jgi:hypothetical protein
MIQNYAIVENGVVVNVAVSESALFPNWIQSDVAQIGWTYDGSSFTPPTPVPVVLPPIITRLAFRYRLTDAEYVGILTAAKTDVSVAAWVETFNIVSQVNLDDPRTKAGLDMMVSKGLLTAERETEILTAPVQPNERP